MNALLSCLVLVKKLLGIYLKYINISKNWPTIYIYMCVCVYTYICVCIHMYMCVYTYIYIYKTLYIKS